MMPNLLVPQFTVTELFNDTEFIEYPIHNYQIFGDSEFMCYRIVRSPITPAPLPLD